jgi:hypothetical protein
VQSFLISVSQCGHSICPEISEFQSVSVTHGGKKEHVIKASAGVTFSVILTESGKGQSLCLSHLYKQSILVKFYLCLVFSFGSAEKGQLGNGTTGERITTGNKTSYDIEPYPCIFPFRNIYVFIFTSLFLVYLKELDGKHIVDIVSGQQHSLALDSTGFVSR